MPESAQIVTALLVLFLVASAVLLVGAGTRGRASAKERPTHE